MASIFKNLAKFKWQESWATIILGAIIVVIVGLLVANFLARRDKGTIDQADMTQQTGEQQAPVAGSNYQVKESDSLSKISETVYGSQEFWPALATINNIANPNIIWTGTTLKLPQKEELTKTREAMAVTSYQVAQGETLFTIAQKVYGDGSKWPVLDAANGMKRLANGNPLVYAGSTITVPR